jgi:hypothetical protein
MHRIRPTILVITTALLTVSTGAPAADDMQGTFYQQRNELDQRNRVWSMQGVRDGSYTGNAAHNRVQTRTQEQERTRWQQGSDGGFRYGQGYESRQSRGDFGGGSGGGSGHGGGGRGGGGGGGRR